MKRLVLLPAFLGIMLAVSSCRDNENELTTTPGCRVAQSNQVAFNYSADGGRLQSISYPEGSYTFIYAADGKLQSISDSRLSTTHPIQTDAAGNITQALGYTFSYDSQNRLVQFEKQTGEADSYRRLEYANGNLNKVYIKALVSAGFDGPPSVQEVLSQSNFIYDDNKTPWHSDKVIQWLVATSLLAPFEIADKASAYSVNNVTGYSLYYASDSENARFTSSVNYTYGSNNTPETYTVTGNAGAYQCLFGYNCGNN